MLTTVRGLELCIPCLTRTLKIAGLVKVKALLVAILKPEKTKKEINFSFFDHGLNPVYTPAL